MEPSTAIVVLIVLSVFFALMYFLGLNEVVKRTLICPRTGSAADVDIVTRYGRPDQAVRVKSCNLLTHPEHIDCGQECLKNPS
jgi:hypothetical protein